MIGKVKAFAVGFLAGIFFAPRSGRASRRLLLERIDEFFEMGSRRLETLEDELSARRGGGFDDEWPVDEPAVEETVEEEE